LNLKDLQTSIWLLWLEVYADQTITEVSKRLRLTTRMVERIKQTAQLRALLPTLRQFKPSQITQVLSGYSELVIHTVLFSTEDQNQVQPLRDYLEIYRRVKAYTTGEDLKARGLAPSHRYDVILSELNSAWLDGKVNSYEEEMALLEQLLKA